MNRSIPSIISNKILDSIENQPLMDILLRSVLLAIAITASMAVIFPAQAAEIARAVWSWQNGAIAKTAFIFVLTFNFGKIAQLGVKIWKNAQKPREIENGSTLEGIPTVELLDHLFEKESFKREEIENKFWIPRNRYTTLAMKLENIGVLIRGENNARVLNTEYSRADVAAILASAWNARELKKVFRQVGPQSFTNEPTAKWIGQKVMEALRPAPSPSRFQLHKLEKWENPDGSGATV